MWVPMMFRNNEYVVSAFSFEIQSDTSTFYLYFKRFLFQYDPTLNVQWQCRTGDEYVRGEASVSSTGCWPFGMILLPVTISHSSET